MASSTRPPANSSTTSNNASGNNEPSYFEIQRAELVREIALSLEQVLQNMNRLNRGLEGVIAVGNEFSSVEALWSQFETVMGKVGEGADGEEKEAPREGEEGSGEEAIGGDGEQEADEEDETVVR